MNSGVGANANSGVRANVYGALFKNSPNIIIFLRKTAKIIKIGDRNFKIIWYNMSKISIKFMLIFILKLKGVWYNIYDK